MSNNKRVDEILKGFRESSIIIHSSNGLGGGEKGAEAFERSLAQASQEIQKMLVEAQTNGVAWAIKEIDYWHGASGGGEYGDKLYKGLKSNIRDSYQFETGLSDPAPNYPVKVKLQAVEQSIKDKE